MQTGMKYEQQQEFSKRNKAGNRRLRLLASRVRDTGACALRLCLTGPVRKRQRMAAARCLVAHHPTREGVPLDGGGARDAEARHRRFAAVLRDDVARHQAGAILRPGDARRAARRGSHAHAQRLAGSLSSRPVHGRREGRVHAVARVGIRRRRDGRRRRGR